MKPIEEWAGISPSEFEENIRAQNRPIVIRGLFKDWPVVKAALKSDKDCADYICGFGDDSLHRVALLANKFDGRVHYNETVDGVNFTWETASLREYFDVLFAEAQSPKPMSVALQSLQIQNRLEGFNEANPRKFAPKHAVPHMWIGNRLKVATHADTVDNLACCVAGKRRFTIFPPEEVSNLYVGPLHFTPAGPPISMVHLDAPDFEKYPKFRTALESAQYVDLLPGDAVYLPFRWYHHVESFEDFNILVNYWWSDARKDIGSALGAFLQSLTSLSTLPPHERAAWAHIFDHFVFHRNGDPWEHLPEHAKSIFAKADPKDRAEIRETLSARLKEGWGEG